MTTAIAEKNILVRDNDGEWYSIPPIMKSQFMEINEKITNSDIGSADWDESTQDLRSIFDKYRRGD